MEHLISFFEKYRYLRKTRTKNLGLDTVGSRYQTRIVTSLQKNWSATVCSFLDINALFINGNLFLFYDESSVI